MRFLLLADRAQVLGSTFAVTVELDDGARAAARLLGRSDHHRPVI